MLERPFQTVLYIHLRTSVSNSNVVVVKDYGLGLLPDLESQRSLFFGPLVGLTHLMRDVRTNSQLAI